MGAALPGVAWIGLAIPLLGFTLALAADWPPTKAGRTVHEPDTRGGVATSRRLREGTRWVDRLGYFTLRGNEATFVTQDEGYELGGLPNLNLERITRTLRDHPQQLVWSVSGTITEYQGSNYLLITRAVVRSNASQSADDLVGGTEPR